MRTLSFVKYFFCSNWHALTRFDLYSVNVGQYIDFLMLNHPCMHAKSLQLCHLFGLYPARLLCPWGSPGKNTGVGCHALLREIFPTQGSNTCLLSLLYWQVQLLLYPFCIHPLLCPVFQKAGTLQSAFPWLPCQLAPRWSLSVGNTARRLTDGKGNGFRLFLPFYLCLENHLWQQPGLLRNLGFSGPGSPRFQLSLGDPGPQFWLFPLLPLPVSAVGVLVASSWH